MGKEITFDKFIRWAGVTLIVLAVLYMTNYLSSVLLPFFIAWFFAYLLYPVVKFIENKLHVRIRALSILIAMGTAIFYNNRNDCHSRFHFFLHIDSILSAMTRSKI